MEPGVYVGVLGGRWTQGVAAAGADPVTRPPRRAGATGGAHGAPVSVNGAQ